MQLYNPKKSLTYFRLICLFCVCILINQITIHYEDESLIAMNENFIKNDEKIIDFTDIPEEKTISVQVNNGYTELPEKGFQLTYDNITYKLDYDSFVFLAAVIASEANRSSVDDVLAVSSVILNRADSTGKTPMEIVQARNQFSGYLDGYYLRYIDESGNLTNVTGEFINTVNDALDGVRNNKYFSFNSWGTEGYSENYIVEHGNRYR